MSASFFFRGIARPMTGIVRTDSNNNIIMSNGGVSSSPAHDEEGKRGHILSCYGDEVRVIVMPRKGVRDY
jgi:hypothetical protein